MTLLFPPFLAGFALCAALIVAIGAQNLFVLRQGLLRAHVGPIVLFCIAADVALIGAGVGGVAAALRALPQLTLGLTLGGAAFLAWYGVQALQRMAAGEAVTVAAGQAQPLAGALAAVAGFTFLNPHVYLDTMLLMGAAGAAWPAPLRPLFVAGAGSASALWFVALGYGARLLAPVFARPAAWRVLDGLVGATMLALAASLALRAL
ncbi:MAG TPA: LysE family transporter [Novosphingobium sp.]|nr:LysE family transporter [Novosphingobium sp.]